MHVFIRSLISSSNSALTLRLSNSQQIFSKLILLPTAVSHNAIAARNYAASASAPGASSKPDKGDLVTFHMVTRGRRIPSPSPYVLKVWTYFNMAGDIPYKSSTKTPFGPLGKSPWIEYKGEKIADSQLIIKFLGKKFNKDFSKNYTPEQIAVGDAVRIMLEEHFAWGLSLDRLDAGVESQEKLFKLPNSPFKKFMFHTVFASQIRWAAKGQGVGRHKPEDIYQFMRRDFEIMSILLGKKPFFLGDTPCETDCALFGMLAQIMYAPKSQYAKLFDEFPNLKQYILRMKEKFWPNWDQQLSK